MVTSTSGWVGKLGGGVSFVDPHLFNGVNPAKNKKKLHEITADEQMTSVTLRKPGQDKLGDGSQVR